MKHSRHPPKHVKPYGKKGKKITPASKPKPAQTQNALKTQRRLTQ